MSIKSKLLAKTGDLQLPPDDVAATTTGTPPSDQPADETKSAKPHAPQFPAVVPGASPRTGPGQMLQFRGQMLAVEGELEKLREQLKVHDGSVPTKKLDPSCIVDSEWANRHPDTFKTARFEKLKADIAAAGGNVQPILVRPKQGEAGRYEIVFGHRRHRGGMRNAER